MWLGYSGEFMQVRFLHTSQTDFETEIEIEIGFEIEIEIKNEKSN